MEIFDIALALLTSAARLIFYVAVILACIKYLRKK